MKYFVNAFLYVSKFLIERFLCILNSTLQKKLLFYKLSTYFFKKAFYFQEKCFFLFEMTDFELCNQTYSNRFIK